MAGSDVAALMRVPGNIRELNAAAVRDVQAHHWYSILAAPNMQRLTSLTMQSDDHPGPVDGHMLLLLSKLPHLRTLRLSPLPTHKDEGAWSALSRINGLTDLDVMDAEVPERYLLSADPNRDVSDWVRSPVMPFVAQCTRLRRLVVRYPCMETLHDAFASPNLRSLECLTVAGSPLVTLDHSVMAHPFSSLCMLPRLRELAIDFYHSDAVLPLLHRNPTLRSLVITIIAQDAHSLHADKPDVGLLQRLVRDLPLLAVTIRVAEPRWRGGDAETRKVPRRVLAKYGKLASVEIQLDPNENNWTRLK